MNDQEIILQYLERIEKKLDKLNGRVRSLEIWRGRILGGLTVMCLLLLWIVPTLIRVAFKT